mgnify:FL=1
MNKQITTPFPSSNKGLRMIIPSSNIVLIISWIVDFSNPLSVSLDKGNVINYLLKSPLHLKEGKSNNTCKLTNVWRGKG